MLMHLSGAKLPHNRCELEHVVAAEATIDPGVYLSRHLRHSHGPAVEYCPSLALSVSLRPALPLHQWHSSGRMPGAWKDTNAARNAL